MALITRQNAMTLADAFLDWWKNDMDTKIYDALGGSRVRTDTGEFFTPKRVLESLDASELVVAKPSAIYLHGRDMYEINGHGELKSVTIHTRGTPFRVRDFGSTVGRSNQASATPTFYRIVGADYEMHQKIEKLEQATDALAKEVEDLRAENDRLRELINTMDIVREAKEFKLFYEMKKKAGDEDGQ